MAMDDFLRVYGSGVTEILGSFAPNGSSALATDTVSQRLLAVVPTRVGVGIYRLTFDESFVELRSFFVSVQAASTTATTVQWGDWVSADRTLDIHVHVAGTLTDLAADDNARVSFRVAFKTTEAT